MHRIAHGVGECLVIESHHLCAGSPGLSRIVVGRINSVTGRVDTTQVFLVMVDPTSQNISLLALLVCLGLGITAHFIAWNCSGLGDTELLDMAGAQVCDIRELLCNLRRLLVLLGGLLSTLIFILILLVILIILIRGSGGALIGRKSFALEQDLLL